MSIYKIIPYLLIVVIFTIMYWVTMTTPNQILYLGYGLDWDEVIRNNKIPLQLYIFNYGLIICLAGLNTLEVFFTKNSKFWMRFLISLLTISFIYLICYFISQEVQFGTKIWNMFYHPRGVPAFFWYIFTIFLTSIFIIILERIKKHICFDFFIY